MSTNKDRKPRARTSVTAKDLRSLVAAISSVLDGYEEVAAKMDARKLQSISMTGIGTLQSTLIKRIKGNVIAAQRALEDADSEKGIIAIGHEIVENRTQPTEKRAKRRNNDA